MIVFRSHRLCVLCVCLVPTLSPALPCYEGAVVYNKHFAPHLTLGSVVDLDSLALVIFAMEKDCESKHSLSLHCLRS